LPDDGWQAALAEYQRVKDDLYRGRTPRPRDSEGLTLAELCNRFLTSKHRLLEAGELSPRTLYDYKRTTDRLIAFFGKDRFADDLASDDFERLRAVMAKGVGPVRLGGDIQMTRSVFRFAWEAGLCDRPTRFGPTFKRPKLATVRKARSRSNPRMFEAQEIRKVLDVAEGQLRAMTLLGINCAFGNADCGTLPKKAMDLGRGWIDYPRPKTGIPRRCPLWPETVDALRWALKKRPEPKLEDDRHLVFLTKRRVRWAKHSASPLSAEFRKILEALGLYRKGVSFYALRHTFRTIADETRDQPAIDLIMGHSRNDMASVYRQRISDDRLRAVTDHVRQWLFGEGGPDDG